MALNSQERHKPGFWKQSNKSHKHGKHKSKGQLEKDTKGRVSVKVLSKKNKQQAKRLERRHQSQHIRKLKRNEVLEKKRNRGGQGSPPHFVVVVALHAGLDTEAALSLLKSCDDTNHVVQNEQGICHLSVLRFKQRVSFYTPEYGNMHALLDAVKVADSLLCLLSSDDGIDSFGEQCLRWLFGQGLPAVTFATQGLKSLPPKKQTEVKKILQQDLEKRFPGEKIHSLDTGQDGVLLLRNITSQKLRTVHYRENRPHLVAENIEFELPHEESEVGTLKVSGYLRGKSLSVNGLIHLLGWGDFQMLQIDGQDDPYPLQQRRHGRKQGEEMGDADDDIRVLEKANPSQQESLESEVIPDPMEGEQTWPTEEELTEAEVQSKKKMVKKVPKGTSEYQAAWITDEEEDDDDDDDEEDDDEEDDVDMEAESDEESGEEDEEGEEYENLTMTEVDDTEKYDENMDMDEEKKELEKIKEEKLHVMFPDEIDTPMDKNARDRFARYRGLKSFRTSIWDPKENLPQDYARIFQFGNFKKTRKRILNEDVDGGALPGWYITVHIANVPKEFMESYSPRSPVVMFGLLQHEQKISVLNMVIRRCDGTYRSIKSKERLVFQVGFRRFSACPIFSQHTNASKHKFERFLSHDVATMATVYAPIMFPPAPVLVFKVFETGGHSLIATGSLSSVNPDRIVTKRAVLSGYPFKINKRSAVVRYMFFNREDIMWFKPVELKTKWGRRGHIKEPLGTHGHMKCVFDGQLKSQDTVLLNLYKRMFPKWTYNSHVPTAPVVAGNTDMDMEEEEEDKPAYQLFD